MKYTLYISENCESCLKVINELQSTTERFIVVNLDREKETVPKNILIIPALFSGNKLLAYGGDIIDFVNRKAS